MSRRSSLWRLRFGRDQTGATAVEFAIVGPIFLLFLFGLIQLTIWVVASLSLQHAAEMAARCAAMQSNLCGCTTTSGCTEDGVKTYAVNQVSALSVAKDAFTISGIIGGKDACGGVKVSASYTPLNLGMGLPTLTANARACYPT